MLLNINFLLKILILFNICVSIHCQNDTSDLNDTNSKALDNSPVDPDLQLCKDQTIDAAVTADDGKGYVFKGDYFWNFDSTSGIQPGFGELISKHWIDMVSPIDASFAIVGQTYGNSTVFVKDKKWFLYVGNNKKVDGLTNDWPYFPEETINAAFTYVNISNPPNTYPIYLISNSDDYNKYNFQRVLKPTLINKAKAFRMGQYLEFLNPDTKPSVQTLKDYIHVKAILTNTKHLVIFGEKNYCIADISILGPRCQIISDPKEVEQFYGCPRSPRPTTTTATTTITTNTTTSTTTTTNTTTTTTTTTNTTTTTTTTTTSATTINENDGNQTDSNQSSQTNGETSKYTSAESRETTNSGGNQDSNSNVTPLPNPNPKPNDESNDDNSEHKSNFILFLLIFGLLAIGGIVVCTVIAVILRNHSKSQSKSLSPKDYKKSKENLETAVKMDDKTAKTEVSVKSKPSKSPPKGEESLKAKNDEPIPTTVKSESSESLNTLMKKSKSKFIDNNEDSSSTIEADQLLEKLKTQSTDHDLYMP